MFTWHIFERDGGAISILGEEVVSSASWAFWLEDDEAAKTPDFNVFSLTEGIFHGCADGIKDLKTKRWVSMTVEREIKEVMDVESELVSFSVP